MMKYSYRILILVFMFSVQAQSQAQNQVPGEEVYIPELLKPWKEWVLDRHKDFACPVLGKGKQCVWPGTLELLLGRLDGKFSFYVALDKSENQIQLPGGNEIWPLQVKAFVGDKMVPISVLHRSETPYAILPAGLYRIDGSFAWQERPKTMLMPPEIGLIKLSIDGRVIERPKLNENGALWLEETSSSEQQAAEEDSIAIEVFRKLSDGLPFQVSTVLDLRISGNAREIVFLNPLLSGSIPTRIKSSLDYQLNSESTLVLQGRAGKHQVTIDAIMEVPPPTLKPLSGRSAEWPAHEVWVWEANQMLRSVELSGVTGIDPKRTNLPRPWQTLPAYQLEASSELTLKETRRGQLNVPVNRLELQKQVWLDLNGAGLSVRDTFSGSMYERWRLNANKEMALGHVKVANQAQLITRDSASGLSGVEVRTKDVSLIAESRIEKNATVIPAVGWDVDVSSLRMDLHLPPGWNLLEASGVDSLSSSWLSSWTLLDVFFVILIGVASARLLGLKWGIVGALALIAGHHRTNSPEHIWVHLLGCVALLKLLPDNDFKRFMRMYFNLTRILLVIMTISFCVYEARVGLFPQLEGSKYGTRPPAADLFLLTEEGIGAWTAIVVFLGALFCFFQRQIRRGILLLVGSVVLGMMFSVLSELFVGPSFFDSEVGGGMGDGTVAYSPMPSASKRRMEQESPPQELRALQEQAGDKAFEEEVDELASSGESYYSRKLKRQRTQQKYFAADPNAVIQTGPGMPNWNWRTWSLVWNGPVKQDHQLKLYLLGPTGNLVLCFTRVILFVAFALVFVLNATSLNSFVRSAKSGALFSFFLFCSVIPLAASPAEAQSYPSNELLQELENKLLQQRCHENCTATNTIQVNVSNIEVELIASVHSDGSGAWSIPGPVTEFYPEGVMIDGVQTTALRRAADGILWVRVPDGVHQVRVQGKFSRASTVTLQFGLPPNHVQVHSPEWVVDGLSPTGKVQSSLQLSRKEDATGKLSEKREKEVDEQQLPNWFIVRREVRIDIPWTVDTVVTRFGDMNRPALVRIPLLKGESVNSETVKVEGNEAIVEFPRGSAEIQWEALLDETSQLELVASSPGRFTENWQLTCSPLFRCQFQGLAPTSTEIEGVHSVRWDPWPGEKVSVGVQKPESVPGQAVTIDEVRVNYEPGVRSLHACLELTVRASQGGWQTLQLPEGALAGEIKHNGVVKPIRPQGRELSLPLEPGEQKFEINWDQPSVEYTVYQELPEVLIGGPAVNIHITSTSPERRWILFVGGPKWGPAVLFWSKLILVIFFGVILGRSTRTPLRTKDWILLGLGLATLSAESLIVPVLWLFALSYRKDKPLPGRHGFNLCQLGIAFLTIISFAVLYEAVRQGLILSPDMNIVGNQSHNTLLRWYVDRMTNMLPRPWIISVPIWVWRVLMLLWSSWMAFAMLRWLKWGWECFTEGGLWRGKGEG